MFCTGNFIEKAWKDYYYSFRGTAGIDYEDNKVYVSYDMPGFEKEEIDVTIANGELKVKAENKKRKAYKYLLVGDKMTQNVEAEYKNGILTITLEMVEPEYKKIEIK